ncbi:hypothetical protein CTI12_AA183380 [Artemisia annua]|uniref:Uncharacterized protein n=1 Tax=Artemisia annua TaxID=35608 RepID=A0A2U1P8E5_ARTAN|nr:hypothetical protein CTI12_AA183380 [Artemisia annua]
MTVFADGSDNNVSDEERDTVDGRNLEVSMSATDVIGSVGKVSPFSKGLVSSNAACDTAGVGTTGRVVDEALSSRELPSSANPQIYAAK